MLRRWVVAIVVVTAGAMAAACGGGTSVEPAVQRLAGDVPVSARDLRAPGSALGDGLVVPGGAALLGAAIPFRSESATYDDHGWWALLVVVGDPRPVVEDLVRQARADGIVVAPAFFDDHDTWCNDHDDATECAAIGAADGPEGHRHLRIRFVRQPAAAHRFARSHLEVSLWTGATSGMPAVAASLPPGGEAAVTAGPPPIPVPRGFRPLPGPGERIPMLGLPVTWAPFVEAGSRVVAGPVPALDELSPTNAHDVVIAIDGDPAEVFEAYLDQIRPRSDGRPEARRYELGGGAVLTQAGGGASGGDAYDLAMVERPGRPAYLRIRSSYD